MRMIHVRRWAEPDASRVGSLDAAFTTDLIYEVAADEACFCLREASLAAPLTKSYPVPARPENPDDAFVAEANGRIIGYAELVMESWNQRGQTYVTYTSPRASAARGWVPPS